MKCEICGKEIEKSSYANDILCDNPNCFEKSFWKEIIENKNKYFFINKKSYCIGANTLFKGFGGKKFKIKLLKNNKIVKTDNLRCQGDIPLRYQKILKDNATFV